jgi:DNA-binding transcriptional regulator YbjK
MIDDKDYDTLNGKYISTEYGDMRRERKQLMEQMIFRNDATVKPRIRELTLKMQEYMRCRAT